MNKKGLGVVITVLIIVGIVIFFGFLSGDFDFSFSPADPDTGVSQPIKCKPGFKKNKGWCCQTYGATGTECYDPSGYGLDPGDYNCLWYDLPCYTEGQYISMKRVHTFWCEDCVDEHCWRDPTVREMNSDHRYDAGCLCNRGVWTSSVGCDYEKNGYCHDLNPKDCLDCEGETVYQVTPRSISYIIETYPDGCVPFDSPLSCPSGSGSGGGGSGDSIIEGDIIDPRCR